MDIRDVPVPFCMSHLPKDARGFPIPYMVYCDEAGLPHFAVNEEERRQEVLINRLCPICRMELGHFKWLVGGPRSALDPHGAYLDPPMHGECAHYALRVCPYLAAPSFGREIGLKKIEQHKENTGDHRVFVDPTMIPGRPEYFVAVLYNRDEFTEHEHFKGLVGYIKPLRPYQHIEFWQHSRRLPIPDEYADAVRAALGR